MENENLNNIENEEEVETEQELKGVQLSNQQSKIIGIFVGIIIVLSFLHEIFSGIITPLTVVLAMIFETALFIVIGIMVIFIISISVKYKKNNKQQSTQSNDIFDKNINQDIFNTSDNIKEQAHKAEHVINNEKCEVIMEKPNKECKFCGAKNPTSAKFCDCCGKRL